MESSRGNDPQRWEKLLNVIDEKLQLGLLDRLRKVSSYHFEDDVLFIVTASKEEYEQLSKDSVLQHLDLLAQDAIGVEKVKIKPPSQ